MVVLLWNVSTTAKDICRTMRHTTGEKGTCAENWRLIPIPFSYSFKRETFIDLFFILQPFPVRTLPLVELNSHLVCLKFNYYSRDKKRPHSSPELLYSYTRTIWAFAGPSSSAIIICGIKTECLIGLARVTLWSIIGTTKEPKYHYHSRRCKSVPGRLCQ